MAIGAIKGDVYTDFKGLAELRLNGEANPEETLRAAGRQFEAMFIQMMLKSMRDASAGDSLMGSGGQDMYQDMFDKQISLTLSAKGALGLGEAMARQMQHSQATAKESSKDSSNPVAAMMPPRFSAPAAAIQAMPLPGVVAPTPIAPAGPRAANEGEAGFNTPEEFVAALWPAAQAPARELGVDPRVLIAQAALETGWGRSVLQRGDGQSSHNLFNIKAGGNWDGGRVNVATLEYRDGVAVKERADFRAYDSFSDSFADYVEFIKSQPRYRDALAQAGDSRQFVSELQSAGYATDPRYAEKIGTILRRDVLSSLPPDFRSGSAGSIA